MQDEVGRWNEQTEATRVKEASKLLKCDFQGLAYEVGGRSRRRGSHIG